MNQEEISSQYERYLDGKLSSGEANELLAALALPENQELSESLLAESFTKQEASHRLTDQAEKRILAHIFKHKQHRLWPRIAVAASILLCCSIGIYFYQHRQQKPSTTQIARNDIAPGHNQATLTLSNGQQIILTKGMSGKLAQQGQTNIQVNSGSNIQYTAAVKETEVAYNTLTTKRGEQSPYPLILADGSKVWLNAASSITFPTAFTGKERRVKVTGEAYFEVVHNNLQPFKVEAANQIIEDIGTHFNVNAYTDEPATITTLLEGAVKVNRLTLKPGEQTDGKNITEADTEEAIAWKMGDFSFKQANIQTVMREFARWYDVDVAYEGQTRNAKITGHVHRNVNASQALKILTLLNIHYRIEGRKITVIP